MESISKILNEELSKKVESILINQIIETHKTKNFRILIYKAKLNNFHSLNNVNDFYSEYLYLPPNPFKLLNKRSNSFKNTLLFR